MTTIDDIVKASGVSRSTIYRFLNGQNVREEAQNAIIKTMEELNYKTDLISKCQHINIEISISENYEDFQGFSQVVQGITERADENGIRVYLAKRTGKQVVDDYNNWDEKGVAKGAIIVGKNKNDEQKEAETLIKKGIPHVFVNRVMDEQGISYVAVNLKKAAYDMVDYLLKNGHRRIAVLGMPHHLRPDQDKLEGYCLAYEDNNLKVPKNFFYTIANKEEAKGVMEKMLTGKEKPTAFFGICDSYAIQFINMAQSLGYKIPDDISVVGMDDIDMAKYCHPALTTVSVPFRYMGVAAVEHLLQLMKDDIYSMKTIVRHEIIVRDSSKTISI